MTKTQLAVIMKDLPDDAFGIIIIGRDTPALSFSTFYPNAVPRYRLVNEDKRFSRGAYRLTTDLAGTALKVPKLLRAGKG